MLYTIKKGDTLWLISKKYNITVEDLLKENQGISEPNILTPGMVITLPQTVPCPYPPKGLPEVNEPYPEIKVKEPNPAYAKILKDDYAGKVSEFTAISLYFYHHLDMEDVYPDIADLLEKISIIEMRHLEMLGELIFLLNGNPTFQNSQDKYWNGTYVEYLTGKPCEQIENDIEAEKAAIENYKKHIDLINDPYVRAILNRIIKDEQLHLKLFTEALNRHCRK